MDNQKQKKPKLNQYNKALRYTGLGFQLVGTIGFSTWLGYWIDLKLGTLPLFLLLLCVGSLVGNIYILIKAGNNND